MKIKAILYLLVCCMVFLSFGCGGDNGSTGATKTDLPDYDSIQADKFIVNGWYTPRVSLESFTLYKEAGFNYIFLQGEYVLNNMGSDLIKEALGYCDQLGLKAFVTITTNDERTFYSELDALIPQLSVYESFVGFNYDEPVVYNNTLNGHLGLYEMSGPITRLHEKYPDVEFLINLNPSTSMSLNWGGQNTNISYGEYLEALETYIVEPVADPGYRNWISADDYPLFYSPGNKTPYYLKTTWLYNLEALAELKRDSEYDYASNFFIQSMSFTGSNRERTPTFEDYRLQMYSLLAFGYDSVSFFCYQTPAVGPEFDEDSYALVDREGNPTEQYELSKRINGEIAGFSNTYMQFNDNWIGVCPIYGTNNTDEDEMYYNNTIDSMEHPLSVSNLSSVSEVKATEDTIIGYMKDQNNNDGFVFVNYNETKLEKTSVVEVKFKNCNKAIVYIDGIKNDKVLDNNTLVLNLGVGQGVFVIPYVD